MVFKVFGKICEVSFEEIAESGYEGLFDPKDYSIKIDKNCERKLHTACHELFHACFFRLGLTQSKIPIELEEIIVENFATAVEENFAVLSKIEKK